jgi:uncharacterized cupin superfamily protein
MDDDVDVTAGEIAGRQPGRQLQLDPRRPLPEAVDPRRQPAGDEGRRAAHGQYLRAAIAADPSGAGLQPLEPGAITIAPGGQIAAHPHTTRPGLVKVVAGEWVEGRPEGETTYDANGSEGIVEDEHTTHWFFNRGTTPATALVCDIVPAS